MKAAGGVIEMGMVEVSECPEGMTLGNVDEGAEATPALMPVLPPCLEAADEFQDMPELEDAEPKDDPKEEPLMNVPPAKTRMDLRGLPLLEDGGSKEDREESLADIPLLRNPLLNPGLGLKPRFTRTRSNIGLPCLCGSGPCIFVGRRIEGGEVMSDASALWCVDQPRMGTWDPGYNPVYCDAECQLPKINDYFVNCKMYRCFVSIECILYPR